MNKTVLDFIIKLVNERDRKTAINDCLIPFTLEECDYLYERGVSVTKETFYGHTYERFTLEK